MHAAARPARPARPARAPRVCRRQGGAMAMAGGVRVRVRRVRRWCGKCGQCLPCRSRRGGGGAVRGAPRLVRRRVLDSPILREGWAHPDLLSAALSGPPWVRPRIAGCDGRRRRGQPARYRHHHHAFIRRSRAHRGGSVAACGSVAAGHGRRAAG
eukprot:scaffold107034_cov63-Phaeocystis_antarctica.AAC.1